MPIILELSEFAPPLVVLVAIFLASFTFFFFFGFPGRHDRFHGKNIPPGSFGLPLIGETWSFVKARREERGSKWIQEKISKHGHVFKTSLMGFPTVVVTGREGNKFVFSASDEVLTAKQPSIVKFAGKYNIFELRGARYKLVKGAMASFLKPENLRDYIGEMDGLVKTELFSEMKGKDTILAVPLMKKLTFNITCSLLFGLHDEPTKEALFEDFSQTFKGMWSIPLNLPGTLHRRGLHARSRIVSRMLPILRRRREQLIEGTLSAKSDVVSSLLVQRDENGEPLSEEEVIDNFITLMIASHDTSAVLLNLMVSRLARDPETHKKVVEEQMKILKERQQEAQDKLTWNEVQKMKYTWRVAQELMRLIPPVFGTFRVALQDTSFGGYDIPKGWLVFWEASGTHMNKDIFKDPTEFDPSRFEKSIPPFAYIPFGAGSRMCMGNEFAKIEVLIVAHYLVTNFEWSQLIPNEPITRQPMPYPSKGLPIKLKARKMSVSI